MIKIILIRVIFREAPDIASLHFGEISHPSSSYVDHLILKNNF